MTAEKSGIKCQKWGGTPTKQRNSNLEFFRIIVMLLIVAHHYVVNSGLTNAGGVIYSDPMSWRSLFLLLFGAWGKIGINCFVLITGYFMCKSQITAKKFAKLLLEVELYKIVIYLIFLLTGYESFSLKGLIKVILPFTTIAHNFTGCFLIFFLCIPFLNVLVRNMSEKMHIRALLLCFFTYVLFGTLPFISVTMNYVSWYIVLYLIASYIRLYPKAMFESKKIWGLLTFVSVLLSAASVVVCAWLGAKLGKDMAFFFVTDSNTFLAVLTGVSSFMFFKNLNMKNNKVINVIASSTFGVLLIHAHGETMRKWLWKDTLDNVGAYDSPWLILHAIGSVVGIYIVCTLIDQLRIHLIEVPFFKFWDKHWEKLSLRYQKTEDKILKKLNIGN